MFLKQPLIYAFGKTHILSILAYLLENGILFWNFKWFVMRKLISAFIVYENFDINSHGLKL